MNSASQSAADLLNKHYIQYVPLTVQKLHNVFCFFVSVGLGFPGGFLWCIYVYSLGLHHSH